MNTQLLSQYGFFRVYKPLARHFKSNDTALLLSHLIDLQEVFLKDKLIDGMFFQQQERMMDYCNLKRHTLRECTKTLFDAGLITIEKKGMPAVNHYRVFIDKVVELINSLDSDHKRYEKLTTSDDTITSDNENNITSGTKSTSHNNNIINNNLTNKNVDIVVSTKEDSNYIHPTNKPIEENSVVKEVKVDVMKEFDKIFE